MGGGKEAQGEGYMLGECVISSVMSCCSKNLKQWIDQCYSSVLLTSKGKYILEA